MPAFGKRFRHLNAEFPLSNLAVQVTDLIRNIGNKTVATPFAESPLNVLTSEWQASGDIASALAPTKSTVHQRLKDMMLRGLAERKVVRVLVQSRSSKTRTKQHYQKVAMFRVARPERQRPLRASLTVVAIV